MMGWVPPSVGIIFSVILLALLASPTPGDAQAGPQVVVTVLFAGPVRPSGGSYYIPFTVDESILRGPQPDSTNWTHYVLLRGGRFFFGRVPTIPYRPFGFEAIRPPEPFFFGELLPDGRSIRARVPLVSLQTGTVPPGRVKVNVVTVDDNAQPLDALGPGAGDPFGFVTLEVQRDTFVTFTDPVGDAPQPSFDIVSGDIQLTVP